MNSVFQVCGLQQTTEPTLFLHRDDLQSALTAPLVVTALRLNYLTEFKRQLKIKDCL